MLRQNELSIYALGSAISSRIFRSTDDEHEPKIDYLDVLFTPASVCTNAK